MKLKAFCLALLLGRVAVMAAIPTNVFSNIVGYVNRGFLPGDNLFGNPLLSTNQFLSSIMPVAPAGTTISLWDSSARQFTLGSTYNAGGWSLDLSLLPGQGALLHTDMSFTNCFVGSPLAPDGSFWADDSPMDPPPPFSGPDGIYLLSSVCPLNLGVTNLFPAFEYIVGRAPQEGEQVTALDAATQLYHTTTFSGGAWDNGDPILPVSGAALFNIGPVVVPEPSCLALGACGILLVTISRRRLKTDEDHTPGSAAT